MLLLPSRTEKDSSDYIKVKVGIREAVKTSYRAYQLEERGILAYMLINI